MRPKATGATLAVAFLACAPRNAGADEFQSSCDPNDVYVASKPKTDGAPGTKCSLSKPLFTSWPVPEHMQAACSALPREKSCEYVGFRVVATGRSQEPGTSAVVCDFVKCPADSVTMSGAQQRQMDSDLQAQRTLIDTLTVQLSGLRQEMAQLKAELQELKAERAAAPPVKSH